MVKKSLTKQMLNGEEVEDDDSDDEPCILEVVFNAQSLVNPAQMQKQASEGYELAWEVLEVARVIYSKDPTKKTELSEVFIWLGDVCLESGLQS